MKNVRRALASLSLFALFASAAVPACSAPQGELVIVLQTDMSLPKDIDTIRLQVLVYGVSKHDEAYERIGSGDAAAIRLPATLGLLAPEDPSTPVTIRVSAHRGGKDGEVRVLREVVTTVPSDRIATLPIPIHFLCDGSAKKSDDGGVASTCEDPEDTCIAGECAPKEVRSSALPNYAIERVFGGGSPGLGGACFDVEVCFEGATPAALDIATCSIAAADGDVNVGLVSESEGICGPSGCFTVLDANSLLGWTKAASGALELPSRVCDWVASGKLLQVVTSEVTPACAQKTESLPTCGPWSSATSALSDPTKPKPVVLAGGQAHPVSLALRSNRVYWTVSGTYGLSDGKVKSIDERGGKVLEIAKGQAFPRDIIVDDEHVFWTNGGTGAAGTGAIMSATLANADVNQLFGGLSFPEGIALSFLGLTWTEFLSGEVYASGNLQEKLLVTFGYYPYRIASSKEHIYFTNEGTLKSDDGYVARFANNMIYSSMPDTLGVEVEGTPRALALDIDSASGEAAAVYWANVSVNGGAGEIVRFTLGGATTREVLAADQDFPNGIAVDDQSVYWTTRGEGAVKRLPKSAKPGDPPITLATGQRSPGAIAVNQTAIYWLNEGSSDEADGALVRLEKAK